MSKHIREFFGSIGENVDPLLFADITASYRFDIENVGSWRVAIVDGSIEVAESDEGAD